jgi:hypothetical protein
MNTRWLIAGISLLGTPALGWAQNADLLLTAAVAPPPKLAVDLTVKAAMVEVAWLTDPVTYPYRLRAEQTPGEEAITISGYVPSDLIRQKINTIAREVCIGIPLRDQLTVVPHMAMPVETLAESNQLTLVRGLVEKLAPAAAKQVQLVIDSTGILTVSGKVDELADRRKLIRALQAIPGCTSVKYDLRISTPNVLAATASTIQDLPKAPEPPPLPPIPGKPTTVEKVPIVVATPIRQGALTSRTPPAPPVQQVDSKVPAPTSDKNKDHAFLVPSASGLTPPSPAVTLGSPAKSYKPSFLGKDYVMPAAAEQSGTQPPKPPELIQTPPASAPPSLPVIPLPPQK